MIFGPDHIYRSLGLASEFHGGTSLPFKSSSLCCCSVHHLYRSWFGMFKPRQSGRFSSDNELWEKDNDNGG